MVRHEPSSISPNRGIFRVSYAPIESAKSPKSNDPSKESYPVKSFGYPNLPFPEVPLGGAVALLGGMKSQQKRTRAWRLLADDPEMDYRPYRQLRRSALGIALRPVYFSTEK